MKKKIGIFIDHDIIIRHFVKSKIFSDLEKDYELHYFFPENHRRVKSNLTDLKIKNFHEILIDEKRSYKIRMFYHATNLRNLKKKINQKDEEKRYKKILGNKLFFFYKYFLKINLFYNIFKFYKRKQIKNNLILSEILNDKKIDLIIHPTVLEGLFVYDLINIGKSLSIPTIFLMNSWDNPSTKALMNGFPDKLFVWGEQTKIHANEYLNVPNDKIIIAGAAQMQLFKDTNVEVKKKYRSLIETQLNEKIICYAGSSRGFNETHQLSIIDDYITQQGLKKIKILYKPHPWKDFSNENEKNFFKYKFENIIMDPYSKENYILRSNKSAKINVDLIDYDYTFRILKSIDGLFTPLSTIMLEATMLGVPVSVYYPKNRNEFSSGFNYDLGRRMFKEFFEKINPYVVTTQQNVLDGLNFLLKKSENYEYKEELKIRSLYFNQTMNINYREILNQNVKDSTR